MLILTPDLRGNVGGVANYYNVLRLHELADVEYFFVNSAVREPAVRRAARLVINYLRFAVKMLTRDYALIHVNPSLNANSFLRDGVFLLLARLQRAPRLIFFRGWEDSFAKKIMNSPLLRSFFRIAYGFEGDYVVLGHGFAEQLRALGARQARIRVETTVADARSGSGEAARKTAPTDSAAALFMSRLLVSKGVRIAIDAVRHYREIKGPEEPSLELWIAGAGPDEDEIRKYVDAHDCGFVTFLGHVTGDAKWRALEEADVFLFPTCYPEGLSNSVLEAMLHGLPVVARPEGALGEVLVDGVHGVVTASKDARLFARRLQALLGDRVSYERIAAHNRDEAERRFTRTRVAARLLEIYAEVRAVGR